MWHCLRDSAFSCSDSIPACDGRTKNLTAISHIQGKSPSVIWPFPLDSSRIVSHIFDQSVICVYVTDSGDYGGMIIGMGRGAYLHVAQLMPLPLTISCSCKLRLVLPFRYCLTWVVLDKGPLNGPNGCCFIFTLDGQKSPIFHRRKPGNPTLVPLTGVFAVSTWFSDCVTIFLMHKTSIVMSHTSNYHIRVTV